MKTQAELNAEAIAQAEDDAIDHEARRIFGSMANTTGSGPKLMILRGVVRDHRAELTRLRTALAESEAMRGRQMTTIDEMRGTIRVLGEECRAWRLPTDHDSNGTNRRIAIKEARQRTNADPAACAAVEGKAPNAH